MLVLDVSSTEKDVNGDTLWVWCYPSVGSDLRQVLLRKCCLTQESRHFRTFVFGQYSRSWYYISTVEVQEPTALTKVAPPTSGEICLNEKVWWFVLYRWPISLLLLHQKISTLRNMPLSAEYSAGKTYVFFYFLLWNGLRVTFWGLLLFWNILSIRMYIKHGSPVKMMEAYIAVLTKGVCQSDENGSFLIKDYDVRKAYLAGSVKGKTWRGIGLFQCDIIFIQIIYRGVCKFKWSSWDVFMTKLSENPHLCHICAHVF